ncbi:MAG: hypothetical protein HOQ05_05365 [Corynebacteriales bacterium]|nr:hypothetical protein [Mycobacteriales bacterium]
MGNERGDESQHYGLRALFPSATLPGGLSPTRALWLLLSRGGLGATVPWALWLSVTLIFAIVFGSFFGLILFILSTLFAIVFGIWDSRKRRYYRITSENQAALAELVNETAQRVLGVAPERLWLVATADVTAFYTPRLVGNSRKELAIGLPLATELSRHELQGLIARELSKLNTEHPLLVERLLSLRERLELMPLPRWAIVSWWRGGFMRQTASLVRAVELEADAAAARAVWPEEAATALLRAASLEDAFTWFLRTYCVPLAVSGAYPKDLLAGWRWKLDDGLRERRVIGVKASDLTPASDSPLPSLEERISVILDGYADRLRLGRVRDQLPINVLSPKEERIFARRILRPFLPRHYEAITFEHAPDDVLDLHTVLLARAVTNAVESLIGRRAGAPVVLGFVADDYDSVARRLPENLTRELRMEGEWNDPFPLMQAVLVAHLKEQGFVAERPLRRHVLVRGADRIDVPELIARDPMASAEIPGTLSALARSV